MIGELPSSPARLKNGSAIALSGRKRIICGAGTAAMKLAAAMRRPSRSRTLAIAPPAPNSSASTIARVSTRPPARSIVALAPVQYRSLSPTREYTNAESRPPREKRALQNLREQRRGGNLRLIVQRRDRQRIPERLPRPLALPQRVHQLRDGQLFQRRRSSRAHREQLQSTGHDAHSLAHRSDADNAAARRSCETAPADARCAASRCRPPREHFDFEIVAGKPACRAIRSRPGNRASRDNSPSAHAGRCRPSRRFPRQ